MFLQYWHWDILLRNKGPRVNRLCRLYYYVWNMNFGINLLQGTLRKKSCNWLVISSLVQRNNKAILQIKKAVLLGLLRSWYNRPTNDTPVSCLLQEYQPRPFGSASTLNCTLITTLRQHCTTKYNILRQQLLRGPWYYYLHTSLSSGIKTVLELCVRVIGPFIVLTLF